jgi:hypothetical protein
MATFKVFSENNVAEKDDKIISSYVSHGTNIIKSFFFLCLMFF